MKANTGSVLLYSLLAVGTQAAPTVDTTYPYTGPAIPVGDWVDPTVNGNGKGFPRLVEPPAVAPSCKNPTNNINVIQTSYLPTGINVHYQTPFGIGEAPVIHWGTSASDLNYTASGYSRT
jgi:acid phosphatase